MAKEKIRIPQRPENDREHAIDVRSKECLTYSVITGLPNTKVYGLFFSEYRAGKGDELTDKGKEACRQFFTHEANKTYRDDYRKTLEKFLGGAIARPTDEISDTRKDKALKSLFHQAMSLVEGKDVIDADTLKVATEIFKKIGLLKDEETREEAPRRYLPVRCGECEYKKFIDEMVALGKIEKTEE